MSVLVAALVAVAVVACCCSPPVVCHQKLHLLSALVAAVRQQGLNVEEGEREEGRRSCKTGAMPSSELVFHVVVLEVLTGAGKVMAAVGKKRQRGGGEIEEERNSGGRG